MFFSKILLMAVIVTGGIALIDKLFFARKRAAQSAALAAQYSGAEAVADTSVGSQNPGMEAGMFKDDNVEASSHKPELPILVDFARALFPVILLVFILRSFIVEPFRIPSGSMIPTLRIGDFILVNKFSYGIRFPVIDKKIIPISSPERGDVMVFKFPQDPSINFIKRVIGIPGDEIVYDNKRLFVNGQEIKSEVAEPFVHTESGQRKVSAQAVNEFHGEHEYQVINDPRVGSSRYVNKVPAGEYFVMGDNRDYSNDSRRWGFVPEEHIVGKAFLVWMSWDSQENSVRWGRLGSSIP